MTPSKWRQDKSVKECMRCTEAFKLSVRRHHCRRCGNIVCGKCSSQKLTLPLDEVVVRPGKTYSEVRPRRVCDDCYSGADEEANDETSPMEDDTPPADDEQPQPTSPQLPQDGAAAVEKPIGAMDMRFEPNNVVTTFYRSKYPGQDLECMFRLNGFQSMFDIAETNCTFAVNLLQDETSWIYATDGFANLVQLCQAEAGIPRSERSYAHEFVTVVKKRSGEESHPLWVVTLLNNLWMSKYQNPPPPLRPFDKIPMGPSILPPNAPDRLDCPLCTFLLVPADAVGLEGEWPPLNLPNSDVPAPFVFWVGITKEEEELINADPLEGRIQRYVTEGEFRARRGGDAGGMMAVVNDLFPAVQ